MKNLKIQHKLTYNSNNFHMKISAKKSHVDYPKFFSWLYNDTITNHTTLSYVNDENTKIKFPKNLLLIIIGK